MAGNRGASVLTPHYRPIAFVDFKKDVCSLTDPEIIDVESDGVCEFMVAACWANPPSLLDHGGKALWVADPHDGTDDSVAVDLDGDGVLEFVVVYNGSSGIRLLDRNGREPWHQPGSDVWAVGAADVDGDGALEILSSAEPAGVDVRDRRGKIIGGIKPERGGDLTEFTLVPYPSAADSQWLLTSTDDAYLLADLHGKLVASLPGPYLTTVASSSTRRSIQSRTVDSRFEPFRPRKGKARHCSLADVAPFGNTACRIRVGAGKGDQLGNAPDRVTARGASD